MATSNKNEKSNISPAKVDEKKAVKSTQVLFSLPLIEKCCHLLDCIFNNAVCDLKLYSEVFGNTKSHVLVVFGEGHILRLNSFIKKLGWLPGIKCDHHRRMSNFQL